MEFVKEHLNEEPRGPIEEGVINLVMRLNGGMPDTLVPFSTGTTTLGNIAFTEEDFRTALDLARRTGRVVTRTVGAVRDLIRRKRGRPPKKSIPNMPAAKRPATGTEMLEWKNSLTRLYHTYQRYHMSVVKDTKIWTGNTLKIHDATGGVGPGLYWTVFSTALNGANREINYLAPVIWDGGFTANPTTSPNSRYFRLGRGGIIYVFAADWPGTIMNFDPLTQNNTNGNCDLSFTDFTYNQPTTNKNIPRTWKSVFQNTDWNYITIYNTDWVFDITNYSANDYIVEIILFRFTADVDAMDYEKQCLAIMGGSQGGTAGYIHDLPLAYNNDTSTITRKRIIVPGLTQENWTGTDYICSEGSKPNYKRLKVNVKRKYILKRPVLTSYDNNLEEVDIWNKYHEHQNGLYFRVMAWPITPDVYLTKFSGKLTLTEQRLPPDSNLADGEVMAALDVKIYKRSHFKLDENSPAF